MSNLYLLLFEPLGKDKKSRIISVGGVDVYIVGGGDEAC